MLRYIGLGLGAVLLAAGLLGANPAAAQGRHSGQWQREHAVQRQRRHVQWEQKHVQQARRPYAQNPPYGNAYGYRARRADRDRDGIPDYLERNRRTYRSRVVGYRSTYGQDFDRDGIPNYRDRDIDGDGVLNYRDRNDYNRYRR